MPPPMVVNAARLMPPPTKIRGRCVLAPLPQACDCLRDWTNNVDGSNIPIYVAQRDLEVWP